MSKARNIADLLDANGDVVSGSLDNVPPADLVNDTTPQLGGNLDLNGSDITGTGNVNVTGTITATNFVGSDLVNDTTPQLGGNLDLNGNDITGTGNVNVTGTITATNFVGSDLVNDTTPQLGGALDTNGNNIEFGDSSAATNNRLKLGAGPDLQIYHDGTNSYVNDTGTGNLVLKGGTQVQLQASNGETALTTNDNGAVTLYYDNATKLATTSSGVSVTGTVAATAFTGDGSGLSGIATGGDFIMRVYNSSTTWAKPSGLNAAHVIVVGGGGGGGAAVSNSSYSTGGHGGSGGYSEEYFDAASLSANVSVTVGSGGAGVAYNQNGGTGYTGGTSSFGAYLSASGGGGGGYAPSSGSRGSGGTGGTASGGQINRQGDNGMIESQVGNEALNYSAAGMYGRVFYENRANRNGSSNIYGGGGTGAGRASNGSNSGGSGGTGLVIVKEFY